MKTPPTEQSTATMVHVVLDVHDDGTLSVHADQNPVAPPPGIGVWRRGDFVQIIDTASHDRAVPVRITVHEADGSSFTDILPAVIHRHTEPQPELDADSTTPAAGDEPTGEPSPTTDAPNEVTANAEGFLPGESILVALVTGRAEATADGNARVVLDPALVSACESSEVVILGRASGTLTVRSLS